MFSTREHNIKYIQILTYILSGYEWWFLFLYTHMHMSTHTLIIYACVHVQTHTHRHTHTDTYTQAQRQEWLLKTREQLQALLELRAPGRDNFLIWWFSTVNTKTSKIKRLDQHLDVSSTSNKYFLWTVNMFP